MWSSIFLKYAPSKKSITFQNCSYRCMILKDCFPIFNGGGVQKFIYKRHDINMA